MAYLIKPSNYKPLLGWHIYNGEEYLTTARKKKHARNYIRVRKTCLKPGTYVRASSGFIGKLLGIEMDYLTGKIQYSVKPDGFAQHDGRAYSVSWWGSSLAGTKRLEKLFRLEKLP